MSMISNPEDVRNMSDKARNFIGEAVDMFRNNNLDNIVLEVVPKTKNSFTLIADDGNPGGIVTEEFSAANLTSANGTFKLARMINYIHLLNM